MGKALSINALRRPQTDSLPSVLGTNTNWVVNILDDLGRMDLWQQWQSGNHNPVKVALLICPSDSFIEPIGGLSYAINYNLSGKSISSINSPARTVLLSERLQTVMFSEGLPAAMWNDVSNVNCLSFPWPPNSNQSDSGNPYNSSTYLQSPKINEPNLLFPSKPGPGLGSNHRGYINITFCDGHTEKIPEATYTWLDPDNQLIGIP